MIGLAHKVERLHRALARAKIAHAFGGAIALAYYTTPRTTIDVDINVFVGPDRYDEITKLLRRIGVDRFLDASEALRAGQVRAWWDTNPVDLFFSHDPIHDAMREAVRTVPFGKTTIPILAPEHLLVAKAVFNRGKDWIDIEQMLIAVPDLDREEVERWLDRLVGSADPRARRVRRLWDENR